MGLRHLSAVSILAALLSSPAVCTNPPAQPGQPQAAAQQEHPVIQRVKEFVANGNHLGAVAVLEDAVKIEPENADLAFWFGLEIWETKHSPKDAETQALRRAVAAHKDNADVHAALGEALIRHNIAEGFKVHVKTTTYVHVWDPHDFTKNRIEVTEGDQKTTRDIKKGMEECEKALKLDPRNLLARFALADAYMGLEKDDAARYQYEEAVRANPDSVFARMTLASTLSVENALPQYREVLRLSPASIREVKAALINRCDAARGVSLNYWRTLNEGLISCQEAVALDPNDPAAHYAWALALSTAGDKEEAKGECRIATHKGEPKGALHLAELGYYDDALQVLRERLLLNPGDAKTQATLKDVITKQSGSLAHAGKREEAFRTCAQPDIDAAGQNECLAEVHYNSAQLLAREGKRAEALAAYQEAARRAPEKGTYLDSLAEFSRQSGDTEGAKAAYRQAILFGGHDAIEKAVWGLRDMDDRATIVAALRQRVGSRPGEILARIFLADVLLDIKDYAAAAAEFREAWRQARLDKKSVTVAVADESEFHRRFGDALFGTGDVDGAIAEYREAVKQEYAPYYYHLALALRQKGEKAEALEWARKAFDKDGGRHHADRNYIELYDSLRKELGVKK